VAAPPLSYNYFVLPFLALSVVPATMVGIKRCHDRNHSGLYLFLIFVPLLGFWWLFIELGFFKGTEGGNRYG